MSALADAARAAIRVDLPQVSPVGGLLRALPVVGLFGLGLAVHSPKLAVTFGVGANLVAINSLVGAHRVRPGLAVIDVVGLGAATFIGALTSSDPAVHLVVLGLWSFAVGLLVVLGVQEASVGVQSVIAFVVFGRYLEAPLGALDLGALVMVGGGGEVLVLLVLRLPATHRTQRLRLANAYRALARLEAGEPGISTTQVENALDAAAALLSASRLVGDADVRRLRALVDEGRRIRLEISALSGLRRQLDLVLGSAAEAIVEDTVEAAAITIARVADAIARSRPGRVLAPTPPALPAYAGLQKALTDGGGDPALVVSYLAHLDSLAGQLRATDLLVRAEPHAETVTQRPATPLRHRARATLRARWSLLLDALDPHSAAFRHAVRLGLAVPGAELIGRALNFPRSYWVALAVVVVLKPDYQSLFRSGLGRVLGTIAGATTAALVIGGLHPDDGWLIVLVAMTSIGAYALWPASFPLAVSCFTALVLILLSVTQVDTLTTAFDRFLDTVTGGAIALVAYLAWPTWSKRDAYTALAVLARSAAGYLSATLARLQVAEGPGDVLTREAHATQLTWSAAESAVGRSLAEPATRRIDADLASGWLAALRRVIQGTHALAVETARGLTVPSEIALADLGSDFVAVLGTFADDLEARRPSEAPAGLRVRCDALVADLAAHDAPQIVGRQFDELVDALDTLAAVNRYAPIEAL